MSSVYFIANYDVTDPNRYEQDYVPAVLRTLAAAGGEDIVATGSAATWASTRRCATPRSAGRTRR